MRCEEAQRALSARLDGAVLVDDTAEGGVDVVDAHLDGCSRCADFDARIRAVRRTLRVEPVREQPDIAGRVMVRIRDAHVSSGSVARRRTWFAVAAAFCAGALAGSVLVAATGDGGGVAAADVARRVVASQQAVRRVEADLEVVERGWHPDVPARRFSGHLAYEAPERLWLSLQDRTVYPSPEWASNDVELVVDGTTRWTSGVRDCPVRAQPHCTPALPRVHVVQGREPFERAWPLPLELVTPVGGFLPGTDASVVGMTEIAGRRAVGVRTAAATVAELLEGLRPAGNLRAVHPLDIAELWLDEESMTPLRLRITAASGEQRDRWAGEVGYDDEHGDVLLDMRVTSLRLDQADPVTVPSPPAHAVVDDAGFVAGAVVENAGVIPRRLPGEFRPYLAGAVHAGGPEVAVGTWVDGRAWLKVRASPDWAGGRLFGDMGDVVRRVALGGGSTGYVSEDGRAVAVHASDLDVVVTGSVPTEVLLEVAAALPMRGVAVPDGWAESSTADLVGATRVLPGVLVPAAREGFAAPVVAVEGRRVTIAHAGPGARGYVVAETPGRRLGPPLDPAATAVAVRGMTGRWNPGRGELEWVEDGIVVSLTSSTLGLGDLLDIAHEMGRR